MQVVEVLCTSGLTSDPHRPRRGTSTAWGCFKVCKPNKAKLLSLLTFTTWDYYPPGNIDIPYWKKCHHFKTCLNWAIYKNSPLTDDQKVVIKVKAFLSNNNLISLQIRIQKMKSLFGVSIRTISWLKCSQWHTLTLSKGFLSSCFLNKNLIRIMPSLQCLDVNEINHFPNEN